MKQHSFEFIDLDEQLSTIGDNKAVLDIDCIETRNISYRYPLTDQYRIKNVNFKINKEKVAFCRREWCWQNNFY